MKGNTSPIGTGKKSYIQNDVDTSPVWLQIGKAIYKFFNDANDYWNSDDDQIDGAKVGEYKGVDVFSVTEDVIENILRKYGKDKSQADAKRKYGAAFDGKIFINEGIDPKMQQYVLEHEWSHVVKGSDEAQADRDAEMKTGYTWDLIAA